MPLMARLAETVAHTIVFERRDIPGIEGGAMPLHESATSANDESGVLRDDGVCCSGGTQIRDSSVAGASLRCSTGAGSGAGNSTGATDSSTGGDWIELAVGERLVTWLGAGGGIVSASESDAIELRPLPAANPATNAAISSDDAK